MIEDSNFKKLLSLSNEAKDEINEKHKIQTNDENIILEEEFLNLADSENQTKHLKSAHSRSAFNVAIRFRPSNFQETKMENTKIWEILDTCIYDTSKKMNYYFDHVFNEESTNQLIFNKLVKDVLSSCLKGINVTIFAYGQTSSGKTHTMFGDAKGSYDGIVPLSVNEIFLLTNSRTQINGQNSRFVLTVSYLEVYNEKLIDLLASQNNCSHSIQDNNSKKVKIIDGMDGAVEFVNLTSRQVSCPEDIHNIIKIGSKARRVAETTMNERSSRSHTILRIKIESQHTNSTNLCVGVLNFVDLAGSESIKRTQLEGDRRKEGMSINRSLLALSQVISQLSEGSNIDNGNYQTLNNTNIENNLLSRNKYINYRDSKITRILSDSLGGNSKTIIVCNCSPDKINYYETLSTLDFAKRAKNIQNKIKVNTLRPKDKVMEILKLRNKISILEKQISDVSLANDLEQENEILKRKHLELNLEINKLKSKLSTKQSNNLNTEANLENLDPSCQNCSVFKEYYFQILNKYAEMMDIKDREIKDLHKEINLVHSRLNELQDIKNENNVIKTDIEFKKSQIVTQEIKLQNVSNHLSKTIEKLQKVEAELTMKNELIANLMEKNDEKDLYLARLKQELDRSKEEIRKFVKWYIYNISHYKNFNPKIEVLSSFQEQICSDNECQNIFVILKNYFDSIFHDSNLQRQLFLSPLECNGSEELLELDSEIKKYEIEKYKIDLEINNSQLSELSKISLVIGNLIEIIKLLKKELFFGITENKGEMLEYVSISESYKIKRRLRNYEEEIEKIKMELEQKKCLEVKFRKLQYETEILKNENACLSKDLNSKLQENKELTLTIENLKYEESQKLSCKLKNKENKGVRKDSIFSENLVGSRSVARESVETTDHRVSEYRPKSGDIYTYGCISDKFEIFSENDQKENITENVRNMDEINSTTNEEELKNECSIQ